MQSYAKSQFQEWRTRVTIYLSLMSFKVSQPPSGRSVPSAGLALHGPRPRTRHLLTISAAVAAWLVLVGSSGDAVRAQAPATAGPSVAPQARRVHPLVTTDSPPSRPSAGEPAPAAPVVMSGTWQALTHPPLAAVTNCLLLTDGTVMCQGYATRNWYKLTPTSSGSYLAGTWTTLAPMQSGYAPIYFSSAVLPDGRVIVEGGEYNCDPSCSAVWGTQGAIYNPVTNSWTPVSPPAGWTRIGDASGIVLSDGLYF